MRRQLARHRRDRPYRQEEQQLYAARADTFAVASSGATDESRSDRYSNITMAMQPAPMMAVGSSSPELTARGWPNSSENVCSRTRCSC